MIDLREITEFEWDSLYVIGEEVPDRAISRALGFRYSGGGTASATYRVVFVKGKRVAYEETEGDWDRVAFHLWLPIDSSGEARPLAASESVCRVRRRVRPERFVQDKIRYSLEPISSSGRIARIDVQYVDFTRAVEYRVPCNSFEYSFREYKQLVINDSVGLTIVARLLSGFRIDTTGECISDVRAKLRIRYMTGVTAFVCVSDSGICLDEKLVLPRPAFTELLKKRIKDAGLKKDLPVSSESRFQFRQTK